LGSDGFLELGQPDPLAIYVLLKPAERSVPISMLTGSARRGLKSDLFERMALGDIAVSSSSVSAISADWSFGPGNHKRIAAGITSKQVESQAL
jgi:hypothetical protein